MGGPIRTITPAEAARALEQTIQAAEAARPESGFKALEKNIYPHEDDLAIKWELVKGRKVYVVVCTKCESKKMLKADNGLRCQGCGHFHAYTGLLSIQQRVRQLTRWNDGLIERAAKPKNWSMPDRIIGRSGKVRLLVGLTGKRRQEAIASFIREERLIQKLK